MFVFHVSVVLGVDVMVGKICPSDGRVCDRDSCDEILMDGSVVVCKRHRNRRGRSSGKKGMRGFFDGS